MGSGDQGSGLTDAQVEQVLTSQSLGPHRWLRRAESDHHDVDRLLPALVARRSLDDAEDIGAVLISRLQKAAQPKSKRRPSPKLVVGLIPVADGPMSPEMAKVLAELADLMEGRAMTLAERAVEDQALLAEASGHPADDRDSPASLVHEVRTVAAYRDRYKVEGRRALRRGRMGERPAPGRRFVVPGPLPRTPPTPGQRAQPGARSRGDGRSGSGTQGAVPTELSP